MSARARDEAGGDATSPTTTSRERSAIVAACRRAYPDLQAVYLFGSRASDVPRPHSDYDLALLLPPETAHGAECLPLSELRPVLERELGQEVDLVNLRIAPTVFAKEIVATGERIDCSDPAAADDFEGLTFSLYQELNVERAEILRDFEQTGIAFAPSAAHPPTGSDRS
jgi:predicted nucleotidyltransferase